MEAKPNIWASKPDIIPTYHSGGFVYKSVEADDWDKYYPYQLLILEAYADGSYVTTPWRFTLPIPPEDLSISMPVADTLHATLTGVVEVSGGAPFRNIAASGTMGILPDRESVYGGAFAQGSVFISTALQPIVNAATEIATGMPPRTKNAYQSEFPTAVTGFYKFHELRAFLESYLAMRARGKSISKGDDNNNLGTPYTGSDIRPENLRLAFAMWKDSSVYLVKLHQFDMRRSASDPLGYSYSLQMQAFKRILLGVKGRARSDIDLHARKGGLSVLSDVRNRIQAVRKILDASKRLVSLGTLGPLAIVREIARQVVGLVKDLLGLVRTIVDMPVAFVHDLIGTLINIAQEVGTGVATGVSGINRAAAQFNKLPQRVRDMLGLDQTKAVTRHVYLQGVNGSINATKSGVVGSGYQPPERDKDTLGNPAHNKAGIDPEDVLDEAPELADTSVEDMPMTADQRAQLKLEIEASLALGIADLERWRRQLQDSADNFTTTIGAWDASYNDTYGLPTPTTVQRDPTQDELDALFAINGLEQSLDDLIVYMRGRGGQVESRPNSMEFVAGLAASAGVVFQRPRSKFGVPMPYGVSLERLALDYLGDADRWHEISTLNKLRAPYIDEVGFSLPLLVNGSGFEVVVGDATNLFLGQIVYMTSNAVRTSARKIVAIDVEAPGQVVVTLDSNADTLKTSDVATLRAYLPGTINSKQIIYIPSQDDASPSADIGNVPGIDINDPLVRMGGVDLLLTSQLDLVVTPWGDNPLAIGLVNMSQQANIAMNTKPGALLQHQSWGFGAGVGTSIADLDMPTIVGNLRALFNSDFDFAGVTSATLVQKGNTLAISTSIGVNGYGRDIPLLLNVGTSTR